MRFFPKPHFRWAEPKPFRRINADFERSRLRWWHKPLGSLICTAILMGTWLAAHLIPDRHPMPLAKALPLGLVLGIVYVYIIPWIRLLCPSEVLLLDAHVTRILCNTQHRIEYSEIASFSWIACDGFATLILTYGKRRRKILLGVPPDISQAAITHFLLDHGIQMDTPGTRP